VVDFDPTDGTDLHTTLGASDVFLTKLGVDGSYSWTRTWGAESEQQGKGVARGLNGDVFVAGYFEETVDFDPGPNEDFRTALPLWFCPTCPSKDIFLTKYLSDGSYVWTATIGAGTDDIAHDVAIDIEGNPIIITQLHSDGSYGYTMTMSGPGNNDAGQHLAIDAQGNLFLVGQFESTIDFDPGEGVDEYTSAGYTDFFLSKFTCAHRLPAPAT
jgi:hypothetical protein